MRSALDMEKGRRAFLVLFTIIVCIMCDQLSKDLVKSHLPRKKPLVVAGGVLKLDYSENKGGVFSVE